MSADTSRENANAQEFLSKLKKLFREYGATLDGYGCGCCGEASLRVAGEEFFELNITDHESFHVLMRRGVEMTDTKVNF